MKTDEANHLISKYFEGETTLDEEQKLREYLRRDDLPNEMKSYADLFRHYEEINDTETSRDFDPLAKLEFEESDQKYSFAIPSEALREGREGGMDSAEAESRGGAGEGSEHEETKVTAAESINSRVMFDPIKSKSGNKLTWPLRIAAGFILLLLGFAAGQLMDGKGEGYASTQQVTALEQEVQQMKKALMNTGNYQPASAGERLSAIHTSTRLPVGEQRLDQQITDILIYTMNNDQTVNVRIAAAEALFRFRDDSMIKNALVNALSQQDDPLMQLTLINMLVELKAKRAVNEMEKLLVDSETREIVRNRLKTGIAQLKT